MDNDDGVTLIGDPITIWDNQGAVEDQGIVEAPSLVKTQDGRYILFYSSGCFSTTQYTQKYATADNIEGPYTGQGAVFKTGDIVDGKNLTGPGGGDVYCKFLFVSPESAR